MRSARERFRTDNHLVVRAAKDGSCEFLNSTSGNWTRDLCLALHFSENDAALIAFQFNGMAVPRPS